jgi:hypothetical protein
VVEAHLREMKLRAKVCHMCRDLISSSPRFNNTNKIATSFIKSNLVLEAVPALPQRRPRRLFAQPPVKCKNLMLRFRRLTRTHVGFADRRMEGNAKKWHVKEV